MLPRRLQGNRVHSRVDFINFKNGRMVGQDGSQLDLTTPQALTAARIICGTYGYDKTSVEVEGVIVGVVDREGWGS